MQTKATTSLQPVLAAIYDMSAGRLGATVAAMIGLIGAVIGGLALARSTGLTRSDSPAGAAGTMHRATAALVLGVIGTVLGGLFVATADGGLGTGNGLGGAVVAVVLGLIAAVLGALARAARRGVA